MLGLLNRDSELPTKALSGFPEDMPVRRMLIDFALGGVAMPPIILTSLSSYAVLTRRPQRWSVPDDS